MSRAATLCGLPTPDCGAVCHGTGPEFVPVPSLRIPASVEPMDRTCRRCRAPQRGSQAVRPCGESSGQPAGNSRSSRPGRPGPSLRSSPASRVLLPDRLLRIRHHCPAGVPRQLPDDRRGVARPHPCDRSARSGRFDLPAIARWSWRVFVRFTAKVVAGAVLDHVRQRVSSHVRAHTPGRSASLVSTLNWYARRDDLHPPHGPRR